MSYLETTRDTIRLSCMILGNFYFLCFGSAISESREQKQFVILNNRYNDCLHWCLPGPIVYLNVVILEMVCKCLVIQPLLIKHRTLLKLERCNVHFVH